MTEVIKRSVAKEAGLVHYFTGKPCKHGHIAKRTVANGSCRECDIKRLASPQAKAKSKAYRDANKDLINAKNKARYEANPEPYKQRARDRYAADPDSIRARNKEWVKRNKDSLRIYIRDYRRRRIKEDPTFRAQAMVRVMLTRCIRRASSKKSASTEEILGYSASEFRKHIESLFKHGMSWANHGKWHVDHIRPLSSFDLTTLDGLRAANSLHNLQPLWAKKNLKKSAKWNGQLTLV